MSERLPLRPAENPALHRQRSSRVLGLLAALALAFLGIFVTPSPAAAFDEGTIHSLANQARSSNGQGPLTLNASLSHVAASWANQMAANGTLGHNPSYSSQIPGGWSRAAENVAQGYPSGSAVHQGWMNSPGHRANILGDFTDIGIAHISAGGTTWSVQVFAKYGSSVPAPAPPAPAPPPPAAPAPPAASAPEAASAPVPAPAVIPPPVEKPESADAPTPLRGAIAPVPPGVSAFLSAADDATAPAGDKPVDDRAESPAGDSGAEASAGLATKLGLGGALLVALITALAGWFRLRRAR